MALYISAGILALLWGNLLVGNIVSVARTFVVARKTVSWVEIPEFRELAKEMKVKLHKLGSWGERRTLESLFDAGYWWLFA